MAIAASGLQTHIWNNNAKSLALMLSFPLLFLSLIWVSAFFYERLHDRFFGPEQAIISSYSPHAKATALKERSLLVTAQAATEDTRKALPSVILAVWVWFIIAYFFHQRIINSASGAHSVTRQDYYRVYNLLENLCISCGMTMPKLYVIDSNKLNAYASGIHQESYAITLTQGIIDTLTDAELEAVIAHELAHIRNGDSRLMMVAMIFVGILSFLFSMVAYHPKKDDEKEPEYTLKDAEGWAYGSAMASLRQADSHNSENPRDRLDSFQVAIMMFRIHPALTIAYFIAYPILMIGHWLALGIRMAVSRRREYVADADAAKLTRNPSALISALRKVDAQTHIMRVDMLNAMCIANADGTWDWFATHPPIIKRISALIHIGGRDEPVRTTQYPAKPTLATFGRKQPPAN